jgi:hypothetical protein
VIIDGIRVATTWDYAPLPVELSSFTSIIQDNSVVLNWRTATEVNNYGFEVQRLESSKVESPNDWRSIGFVNGNGNSNSVKEYSFVDNTFACAGKYLYRLKQIDNDGKFEYSNAIEVNYDNTTSFNLVQNFPNPFNPITTIIYQLPENSLVILKVYDVLGNEVTTLVNGNNEAGIHRINFDASNLSAGTYFYKLQAEKFIAVKKLLVIK